MKKLLLSLACFFGLVSSAFADDPLFVSIETGKAHQVSGVSNYTSSFQLADELDTSGSEIKAIGNTWTVVNFNNNNRGWDDQIRAGQKSNAGTATITTDNVLYATINKVVVNMSVSSSALNSLTLLVSSSADDWTNAKSYTASTSDFNTSASDVAITVTEPTDAQYYRLVFDIASKSSNGTIRVFKLSYYGEATAAPSVSTPIITLGDDNKVSISADEDATVYYTLDGSDPTDSSTKYEAPFEVTSTDAITIKAIAIKDSDKSAIAEKTVTPHTVYTTIADVLKAAPEDSFILRGPLTVIYQKDANTYVQDAAGTNTLIYAYTDGGLMPQGLENGNQLGDFIGTYTLYSGLPELKPSAALEKLESNAKAIEAEETSIEDLAIDATNLYVKLVGVSIKPTSDAKNFTLTDNDGNSVVARNNYGLTMSAGENFTVYAFSGCYVTKTQSTVQVYPTAIDDSKAKYACATPVFSTTGSVNWGTKITVTTETEGASIFYTTDGTEPTVSSTEYADGITLTESCTIKAIAVKEGNADSDVASADFTVLANDAVVAQFNFTDPTTLSIAEDIPEDGVPTGNGFNLDEYTIVGTGEGEDIVEISFNAGEKAGSSQHPRLFKMDDGSIDLRLYSPSSNDQTIKIFVNNNRVVNEIDFTSPATSKLNITPNRGTWKVDGKEAKWTAKDEDGNPDNTTLVVFTVSATSRINTIKVIVTDPDPNGGAIVSDIAIDSENAPAEYFNLQGVRVANPTPGLYIVRQGNKVTKQVVR